MVCPQIDRLATAICDSCCYIYELNITVYQNICKKFPKDHLEVLRYAHYRLTDEHCYYEGLENDYLNFLHRQSEIGKSGTRSTVTDSRESQKRENQSTTSRHGISMSIFSAGTGASKMYQDSTMGPNPERGTRSSMKQKNSRSARSSKDRQRHMEKMANRRNSSLMKNTQRNSKEKGKGQRNTSKTHKTMYRMSTASRASAL